MKKMFITAIAAGSIILASSCGAGMMGGMANQPNTNQQQGAADLGTIIGSITGIGDILSGALGITTTDIVGTWVYKEPSVVFDSENLLTKAGGKIAAQKIATKLDTYYQKVGITPGKMTMTFDKSGNFTQTIGSKQQSGTYKLTNGNVSLTYANGTQQIVGNTQFDGNNLVLVVDMTKLLNFTKAVSASSSNSTLQGISSIASGINGMKAGLKFSKK